ncbi:MAG: DUF4037 domain-containing protein [Coriobacteriia bacterium]|nr:DUF4037 domain-containing protein [Coriobacteriia bacterium]
MPDNKTQYTKGLERAWLWWDLDLKALLQEQLPDIYPYMAVGLVGDGSDCFGFDDATSMDHDNDTRIKVWIPMGCGGSLTAARIKDVALASPKGNIEVQEISQFYQRYTGLEFNPSTWREWIAIPQKNLAAATNGEVFYDGPGRFSARRKALLSYYPEQVRIKLLESATLLMGQAGQYNYQRSLSRGEFVAAELARSTFIDNALNAVFLLNKSYKPFYKWAHRAVKDLPILGEKTWHSLNTIVQSKNAAKEIEALSVLIADELQRQDLSKETSTFLVDQAHELRHQIEDLELKEENPWKI